MDMWPLQILREVLEALPYFLPFMAVDAIGGYVAVSRWQRHPRVSRMALFGLAACFLVTVVTHVLYRLLARSVGMEVNWQIVGFLANVVHSCAFGVILVAVFMDRPDLPRAGPRQYRDEQLPMILPHGPADAIRSKDYS